MKTKFTKKVGFHRGKPRIYFQEPADEMAKLMFGPGQEYFVKPFSPVAEQVGVVGVSLLTRLSDGPRRKVCKKVVGVRTLCIIDLNAGLDMFAAGDVVNVEFCHGHIVIWKDKP